MEKDNINNKFKELLKVANEMSDKVQELLDLVFKYDQDLQHLSPDTWGRISELNDELDPETILGEFYIEDDGNE